MEEQLKVFMKLAELTPVKLAEILSVQPSNISHILSGRNNPSFDFIVKFAGRFPDVNLSWLLTGKGEVYISKQSVANISVTSVNGDDVTNVTSSTGGGFVDLFGVANGEVTDVLSDSIDDTSITDAYKPNDVDLNNNTSLVKSVKRILILHSDNSFEIYQN